MKILLIHNVITPTRTELLNEMYNHFLKTGNEFKIIFNAEKESNREWDINAELKKYKFPYKVLKSKQLRTGKKDFFYFHFNSDFYKKLNDENADIIIHFGWASYSVIQTKIWCKKNNKNFILWSGSTKYEPSWRRFITKSFVKYIVKGCDGYRSYGTRASEYLVSLGADKGKIYPLYNCVDSEFFTKESERLILKKNELKKKYRINTKYVLLFVGQLIERKGIYEILSGFNKFQKRNKNRSLVFLGEGQENKKMKRIIERAGIRNVYFPGFFQKDKICEWYALADVFTLPSREEVWGLVINEAMYFGLPVITAYQVGASVDLVKEGENGYIMDENTGEEFEKCMNKIVETGLIEKNSSKEIIKNFNVKLIVEGIKFI